MDEQEHLRKQALARERAFLFLSVLAAAVLLSGSPRSLLVFFSGTFNSFTGASIVLEPVGMKDYFTGLVIFAALVAISFYIVHVLRNPKPQLWKAELPEQKKEALKPLAGKYSLDTKLDQLNEEINELRIKKESPASTKRPKKLTRIPNVREEVLGNELRKVTAGLQGYRKPTILEAPREKTKWDDDLEKVKTKIHNVDKMKINRVKIRETAPSMKEVAEAVEKKRLTQELKKVSAMLKKGERDPSYFIRRYIPSLRERELAQITKKLQQKGSLPAKELAEIEKKLMMLKRKE